MTILVILRSRILEIWVNYEENEKMELKQRKNLKVRQDLIFQKKNERFAGSVRVVSETSEKAEYQSSVGIYQKTSKYWKESKKKWKIEKFAEKFGKS